MSGRRWSSKCLDFRRCVFRLGLAVALPVFGGVTGEAVAQNPCFVWDVAYAPDGPPGREDAAMAYDSARGVTVLFGGWPGAPYALNDTWEWDGVQWHEITTADVPRARAQHAMAYDSNRGVVVMQGGVYSTQAIDETWEYDGSNWTLVATGGPGRRCEHTMAYDSARGVTVLFGGGSFIGGGDCRDDTWEWDGSTWTEISTSSRPAARASASMVYDSARGVTVLFGGATDCGTGYTEDTWEYDGLTWTHVSDGGPNFRLHAMAYDGARERTILSGERVGDWAWEWDGAAWTPLDATNPQLLIRHAMAYDSARHEILAFGNERDEISDRLCRLKIGRPSITQQPVDTTAVESTGTALAITLFTPDPAEYQWFKNGEPIPGAESAVLVFPAVSLDDMGVYDVLVTSMCGDWDRSDPATLTVTGTADLDFDGNVGLSDLAILLSVYGTTYP